MVINFDNSPSRGLNGTNDNEKPEYSVWQPGCTVNFGLV